MFFPPNTGKALRTLAYLGSCMVRASISSCFLVPVVRIPNCLHASFSTGTVSLPKVPFATWFFSSSSDISTLGFFSAPPPPDSAVQKDETIQVKILSRFLKVVALLLKTKRPVSGS